MKRVKNSSELSQTERPVVLAMGCFDGVHIGHQKVISTAVEQARHLSGDAWVYTFHPHPAKVLCPDKAPPLISAEACRLRQFAALGVAGVIEVPFDRAFAQIEPDTFLAALWQDLPMLRGVVCGADWSFGYKARGTFQTLDAFCRQHGITATAVPPVLSNGERVSSTHIRQAVRDGNIPAAERLLGRPFSIFGTVVSGRGIGRGLGFPTANLDPDNELIPASGVYAAYTKVPGSGISPQTAEFPSAVFIGERKTFNDPDPVIESYLFDFDQDLYGQRVEVQLVQKIRDVEPFPSREELVAQIARDVARIREILAAG